MLLNLSNHPSFDWDNTQRQAAEERWGAVVDLPFPTIDPTFNTETIKALAATYYEQCLTMLASDDGPSAVHLMGEMVFCYHLINRLKASGVQVVASTTKRSSQTTFRFVTFRDY